MKENGLDQPGDMGAVQKRTGFRVNAQEWIVILLIALSIIGVGFTDFSPAASHWY